MNFEFDSRKNEQNLETRGFDFAFASRIFEGRTIETVDLRRAYGETRVKAIGEVEEVCYVVVFTDRDEVRRIISARVANRKERERWQSSG